MGSVHLEDVDGVTDERRCREVSRNRCGKESETLNTELHEDSLWGEHRTGYCHTHGRDDGEQPSCDIVHPELCDEVDENDIHCRREQSWQQERQPVAQDIRHNVVQVVLALAVKDDEVGAELVNPWKSVNLSQSLSADCVEFDSTHRRPVGGRTRSG